MVSYRYDYVACKYMRKQFTSSFPTYLPFISLSCLLYELKQLGIEVVGVDIRGFFPVTQHSI